MTPLFLHFWNLAVTFRIWSSGKKNPYLKYVSSHFLILAIAFGPLRIRCLFYIWTTLLITVHTFAVFIILLYIWKYAILLHLAWLNSKKLGFTLFLLYSHKGWTATLVCDSFYSLLGSGWVYFLLYSVYSTVNCTSATSYNCDATITFFLTAQQWTSDVQSINISCSAICTQPPVQITGLLGVWMRHGDLKIS